MYVRCSAVAVIADRTA